MRRENSFTCLKWLFLFWKIKHSKLKFRIRSTFINCIHESATGCTVGCYAVPLRVFIMLGYPWRIVEDFQSIPLESY